MTKQELISHLLSNGWQKTKAEEVAASKLIDYSVSLDEWTLTFVGAFLTKHSDKTHIVKYVAAFLGVDVPKWEHLTKARLAQFKSYIVSQTSANTAHTYLAILLSIINTFSDEGVLPSKSYEKVMSVKQTPSQHIALTEEEIERIHRYQPQSLTERDVKRAFMLEAYTGARSSDIASLSELKISRGMLTYVSQKTKTKTTVPVHRNLETYLNQPTGKKHSRSVYNTTIQRICRKVGINSFVELFQKGQWLKGEKWQFVTSHCARRSFCTSLALRGVPIEMIAKLAGHRNSLTTSRSYIAIDTSRYSQSALDFFQ